MGDQRQQEVKPHHHTANGSNTTLNTETLERCLYWGLVALRIALVVQPGYVHPDEFFQSGEVASTLVFPHRQSYMAWEFDPSFPCRSIFPPLFVSGLPLFLLRLVSPYLPFFGGSLQDSNSYALLYAPRFFVVLLSLLVDWSVRSLCRAWRLPTYSILNTLASSWVMLVFHVRPFSNTLESILVALTAALVLRPHLDSKWSSLWRNACVGVVAALGLFTRFTYLFFSFPLALYWLYINGKATWRWDIQHKSPSLASLYAVKKLLAGLGPLMLGALTFTSTVFMLIMLDSAYYGLMLDQQHQSQSRHLEMEHDMPQEKLPVSLQQLFRLLANPLATWHILKDKGWAITPLNSLLYNARPENLAQHGLHPNYLHAVVNMPMLFGPMLLLLLISVKHYSILPVFFSTSELSSKASKRPGSKDSGTVSQLHQQSGSGNGAGLLVVVMWGCLLSGLGFLSLAPHQEPRFLVPLLAPMAVLTGSFIFPANYVMTTATRTTRYKGKSAAQKSGNASKAVLCTWLAFNTAMLVFFGVMHQGGIIPSIHQLSPILHSHEQLTTKVVDSEIADNPSIIVVFYRTYMPPRYLLSLTRLSCPNSSSSSFSPSSTSSSTFTTRPCITMEDAGGMSLQEFYKLVDGLAVGVKVLLVVSPASFAFEGRQDCFRFIHSSYPHLSTEELGRIIGDGGAFAATNTSTLWALSTWRYTCTGGSGGGVP
ncbi:Mannosyltransferase [Balamuthia mandrillaris]